MSKRTYNQYCAIARALDVIGDRWTLLLVRELMLGPKRYGDLLAASPGIGTNLLADRLRELESAGLVERIVLPPPAGSTVYQLTEAGSGLEPVMMALGRWGRRFMGPIRPDEYLSPGAFFIALRARFDPENAVGVREAYEFRVEGRVFEVRVEEGVCVTSEGRANAPAAIFTLDVETFSEIFFGRLTAEEAVRSERVQVTGDKAALARFQKTFPPLQVPTVQVSA